MSFLKTSKYNALIGPAYSKISKELSHNYNLITNPMLVKYKNNIVMPESGQNYVCSDGLDEYKSYSHRPILKNGQRVVDIEKGPDDLFFKQLFTAFLNNFEAFLYTVLLNKPSHDKEIYVFSKNNPPTISYQEAIDYLSSNDNAFILLGDSGVIPSKFENRILKVSETYEIRDRITAIVNTRNFLDPESFILIKDINSPIINVCLEKTDEQKLLELLEEESLFSLFLSDSSKTLYSSTRSQAEHPFSYFTYSTNPAEIIGWVVAKLSYEVLHDNYFVGTIN